MKNWLEIVVGLYLLGMILYGHYRGAIRMAVSMVALIATFLLVHTAMPSVAVFIKNQTPIYGWLQARLENVLLPDESQISSSEEIEIIEKLNLPQDIQDLLMENSNSKVYEDFGIDAFTEYVSGYVAGLIINGAGFVILFLIVYAAVHIIMRWLDLMARLPIVSGVNKIAGTLLGGIQGMFFIWLLMLLVTVFSRSSWAGAVIAQIESSKWLAFLYHYNFLPRLVLGIVKGIM